MKSKLVAAGSTLAIVGLFSVANPSEASANEYNANSWQARTVTEVKEDIKSDENGSEYTFQWGDTLSSIALATDISVDSLVKINDINNADMIIAGNSIHLSTDHSVVTVENNDNVKTYNVSEDEVKEVETPKETETEVVETEVKEEVVEETEAVEPTTPAAETEATQPAAEEKSGEWVTVEATAYSTNQPELSDTTYTGINLNENPNVIAVDPSVIPLGSTVYVPGYGTFIAGDTGSAINGHRIDVHMTDLSAALQFGRQTMDVQILN
ncbi:3D domain-containing protein [Desemzia sp. RIT 804]|uniref:3D domain-containing protein n=1 Tax=Desemzia sp. RIT 804 TaxID=2810209 RepID=UPI001EECE962|nr:3D domain-containing protein [Desemzia sp. RIT 804]